MRLLLPLFWLRAPAKVGASGKVRVVGWRSLHALPSTSACWRRQAAARHERLAVASRSKMQRSLGRRSRCLAFPVSNNQGNPLGRGTDVIFSTSPAWRRSHATPPSTARHAGLLDGAPRRRPPPEHLPDPRPHEVAAVQERCPAPVLVTSQREVIAVAAHRDDDRAEAAPRVQPSVEHGEFGLAAFALLVGDGPGRDLPLVASRISEAITYAELGGEDGHARVPVPALSSRHQFIQPARLIFSHSRTASRRVMLITARASRSRLRLEDGAAQAREPGMPEPAVSGGAQRRGSGTLSAYCVRGATRIHGSAHVGTFG